MACARLDSPHDWIRLEIVTALQRGIRVVPVLVDGAALPEESALPEDLRPLVRRQALELADGRWKGDLQRLVTTLAKLPGLEPLHPVPTPSPAPGPAPAPAPKLAKGQLWKGIGIGAVGLLVVAAIVAENEKDTTVEPLVGGGGTIAPLPRGATRFAADCAAGCASAGRAERRRADDATGAGAPCRACAAEHQRPVAFPGRV